MGSLSLRTAAFSLAQHIFGRINSRARRWRSQGCEIPKVLECGGSAPLFFARGGSMKAAQNRRTPKRLRGYLPLPASSAVGLNGSDGVHCVL